MTPNGFAEGFWKMVCSGNEGIGGSGEHMTSACEAKSPHDVAVIRPLHRVADMIKRQSRRKE